MLFNVGVWTAAPRRRKRRGRRAQQEARAHYTDLYEAIRRAEPDEASLTTS